MCQIIDLSEERRTPEKHTNISATIERPLLVFGEEENANPPEWLPAYLEAQPPTGTMSKTVSSWDNIIRTWDYINYHFL